MPRIFKSSSTVMFPTWCVSKSVSICEATRSTGVSRVPDPKITVNNSFVLRIFALLEIKRSRGLAFIGVSRSREPFMRYSVAQVSFSKLTNCDSPEQNRADIGNTWCLPSKPMINNTALFHSCFLTSTSRKTVISKIGTDSSIIMTLVGDTTSCTRASATVLQGLLRTLSLLPHDGII